MISTSEIAPSPALAPFVRCYTFRAFDTAGQDLIKPWHASPEMTMPFFFKALPVKWVDPETGAVMKRGHHSGAVGLATQYNGDLTFNGTYAFFEISFKPNGFFKIFGIPCNALTNQIFHAGELFDSSINLLFEQLCEAGDLNEMAVWAEQFLLRHLNNRNHIYAVDSITAIAHGILKNSGLITIEQMAYDANMSLRSFERHFSEQVGASPKLFCALARFSRAFALKLQNPAQDWSTIALHCGYFDQTHLIKDFKRFAGSPPVQFLKQTPLTQEVYTSRVEV